MKNINVKKKQLILIRLKYLKDYQKNVEMFVCNFLTIFCYKYEYNKNMFLCALINNLKIEKEMSVTRANFSTFFKLPNFKHF